MADTPKLAPPGAGIPLLQRLVARYWYLPRFFRGTTWEQKLSFFEKEARKMLDLARPLDADRLAKQVLVPPQRGLEDSSRFWSVAETLEHLMIVQPQMANAIVALSNGKVPSGEVKTAAVKPKGKVDPRSVLDAFEKDVARYREAVTERTGDRASKLRFKHPWFGPLTAEQWHGMAGLHANVHRKQIQEIVKGLGA